MNGLSLRISSGAKKSKNICLPPVVIKNHLVIATENEWMDTFLQSETADGQLSILKKELENLKDPVDTNVVKLLVVVFFHSEARHPVKCFLTRHVTRNNHIQETFAELLTSEIILHLDLSRENVLSNKDMVSKIGMCLENFPTGTHAVNKAAEKLTPYLFMFLDKCVSTFRNMNPSPTEKNSICSLAHLALKILLHIITEVSLNVDRKDFGDLPHKSVLLSLCPQIKGILYELLHDKEVPMDTKSLCGIVFLLVDEYNFCWPLYLESPLKFIERNHIDEMNDEVQLAMYSAIVKTVPVQKLQEKQHTDKLAAISVIVQRFMDIVERNALEGVLVLGVARSLLLLSKSLGRLKSEHGLPTAASLLSFVWAHLEHYMDSVRHLAAQILTGVVHYCATFDGVPEHKIGEREALDAALDGLAQLGGARRGYYAGVRGCAAALGAGAVLRNVAPLPRLLRALPQPQLCSTVARTLDELLTRHSQETEACVVHEEWLVPILHFVRTNDLAPEVITVLENLLSKAVNLDPKLSAYILPHIKQACESPDYDLKNVLVLLSVTRGSLAKIPDDATSETQELWGGVLPYQVLKEAVVDAQEEVRLAGLVLTAGGVARAGVGAGAGGSSRGELDVVLHYLTYCANEPTHVRQKAIAILNKFIKRLVNDFRAAKRNGDEGKCQMYRDFDDQLRQQCYGALQPDASYSRRTTALQLLQTLELRPLQHRNWKPDYVEKLLLHLDDSYETNKALALEILQHVPLELLQDLDHSSLNLENIVRQAGALKPTECVSAAYKLELVCRRLPDNILQGNSSSVPEPAVFSAIQALLRSLKPVSHVVHMPRDCPGYGVLHCIAHLLERLRPEGILNCLKWESLISSIISNCSIMLELSGQVVNNVAPEGVMPEDCQYTDYGNNAGVILEDDRLVTAQMVLLCAWRTVKEATAVLSSIGARLSGWYQQKQLAEQLGSVLIAARHRGAFEQAYVAYSRVLHSMWRHEQSRSFPPRALARMMTSLRTRTNTADRRSAGLPFLIQALVSTEVNAGGPGSALHGVMKELLRLADAEAEAGAEAGAGVEEAANRRAHACNILRTLYKDSSLDTAVQSYVGEGLRVALKGFEGATWAERNSSTLLLSALVTRVFGVTRARGGLSARNRMTGRVFYLRYPLLYDVMLNKLKEATESEEKLLLCPSLYPVLLLLGRLYPSSLEGTESNLKLVSFVPYVVACGRSRVLLTRRLAAGACVALVSPDRYVAHVQYLLGLVSDARVERNFCHGLLLQICALLDHKPEGVACGSLADHIPSTLWLMQQEPMCFPVLHQYVLMLTTLLTRFPEALRQATLDVIAARMRAIVFESTPTPASVASGRELCVAACLRLQLLLTSTVADASDLILRAVQHDISAVSTAALDCLLALYGRGQAGASPGAELLLGEDAEAAAENEVGAEGKGGALGKAEAVLCEVRGRARYLPCLVDALRSKALWRCDPQRAGKYLEVIVAERGTQKLVGSVPPAQVSDWITLCYDYKGVVYQLVALIDCSPESTTHLYVESLISYMVDNMESLSLEEWRRVRWLLVGDKRVRTLDIVPRLLRGHYCRMLQTAARAEPRLAFVIESCVFMSLAVLLRAPTAPTRALAAQAARSLIEQGGARGAVARRCGAALAAAAAARARAPALLASMALCHRHRFYLLLRTQPQPHHKQRHHECRVFDSEDEYVDDEEAWVVACADEIVALCAREGVDPITQLISCIEQKHTYDFTFDTEVMLHAAKGDKDVNDPVINVFINRLRR